MRREGVVSRLFVAAVCVFAGAAMAQTGSFYTVNIRVPNGQYVTAEWGGERELVANRNTPSVWERFVLVDLTGGELNAGDAVQLRAQNGKYVCAIPSTGALNADRSAGGPWETFLILKTNGQTGRINSGDPVYLKAWDGHWVSAYGGGGGLIRSDGIAAGFWEVFRVDIAARSATDPSPLDPAWVAAGTPVYSIVNIQASSGHYFVAEDGRVKANRATAGSWERFVLTDETGGSLVSGDTVRLAVWFDADVEAVVGDVHAYKAAEYSWGVFRIHKVGGSGVINNGDQFRLEAFDGRWVVAENGGGGLVRANRTSAGPWETFRLWVKSTHLNDPGRLP